MKTDDVYQIHASFCQISRLIKNTYLVLTYFEIGIKPQFYIELGIKL